MRSQLIENKRACVHPSRTENPANVRVNREIRTKQNVLASIECATQYILHERVSEDIHIVNII